MFYERDMKLGEIINFTRAVVKRNKKIYANMFLIYAAWNLLNVCVMFALPDMGLFSDFITIVLYIISFCIFLGLSKTIYGSIYDENYSENHDRESVINYVKERWLKAFAAIILVWLVGSVVVGVVLSIPMTIIIFDFAAGAFSFGAVISAICIIIITYVFTVIIMYYLFEISLNNDIKMVNAEVVSILKIKKANSLLNLLPLSLFSVLIYIIWFVVVYGSGYLVGKSIGTDITTSETGIFIFVLTVVGVVLLCLVNLFIQSLWLTKYYNMKNAIVYELNGGKHSDYDNYDEINSDVDDNKEVENEIIETVEEKTEDVQKPNSEDKSNVVGESSMWGKSTNIEDNIVGNDTKEN